MNLRPYLLAATATLAFAGCAETDNTDTTTKTSKSEKSPSKTEAKDKKPEITSGQKNALKSAENYIDLGGFSKKGLIRQLSSSAGDGFSKADATFAANNVDVDYKKEAVESAKAYLEQGGFSKDALTKQLTSPAGDQYTPAQARYAVNEVY